MGRRKTQHEHENHERWLVSYADFITLLFAFFVVMYSISSVNEGKYKVLSKTLVAAFTGQPTRPLPLEAADGSGGQPRLVQLPPLPTAGTQSGGGEQARQALHRRLAQIAQSLAAGLAAQIRQGQVQVRLTPLGVVIDIHDNVLFASGSAQLGGGAQQVLSQVSGVLARLPYQFQVNGYTDDKPIHNAEFASNWELSTMRALSVLNMLVGQGVAPQQLVAAGYGQYHPVDSNATPEGRAANRRVSIVIVSPDQPTGSVRGTVIAPPGASASAAPPAPSPDTPTS
ncbi:flagellar motor protein MotD [Thiomonas sp.]|jgi:chemotaxis protein MotB|uniref:flagellar motor protein MotD n=1 Tax=Thiomonas sp. TaxID=2047785 RepID=UPI002637D06C|nr:flagellar motor protein MotD [Thiomonas sp.]